MKLIFCPHCNDVVKLREAHRTCWCGKSGGMYLQDGLHAIIYGDAVPIGFQNKSFYYACLSQPEEGKGKNFIAFVIPKQCPTVRISTVERGILRGSEIDENDYKKYLEEKYK